MELRFNPFTRKLDWTDVTAIPPGTIISLTGDLGPSVGPDGSGNINVLTGDGLTTTGNAGTNTVTWTLDNYFQKSTTTSNATPDNSMTFSLGGTPGTYTFDINISAYNATDILGAGYSVFGSIRTTGAAGSVIGTPDKITNEEVGMTGCDANLTVSGNNAVIQVTGIAAKTIRWKAIVFYTLVT